MRVTCDLFCAVVDNLGDAAVCWRLARQLATEYGWTVRLWIDDRAPLALLRPGIDPTPAQQTIDGVDVRLWSQPFPQAVPGDVVIEAFACELPQTFVDAMARRSRRPVWLNLEYLSAEAWVVGCHGLSSPHPRLPLVKHFFFPGFVPGTGGLIREFDLAPPPPRTQMAELTVSLFCYDNPALPGLLDAWASGDTAVRVRVAEGLARRQVETWLGTALSMGIPARRGNLGLEALPFLPQPAYDTLLADCDVNFVRGEDSFIRAQWAERPFVWQIYPQAHGSHETKLAAFLALYRHGVPGAVGEATAAFWQAWNGSGDTAAAWPAFRAALPALRRHAAPWAEEIRRPGNLAENLVKFSEARI
jgi:hypothetical protein